MHTEDSPALAGSQDETIAIRVRRWRQRNPLWWLLPGSLGLLGCTLLAGAVTLGAFGPGRASATERPAPAVMTTAGAALAGTAEPGAQAGAAGTVEPEERPLTIVLLGSDRRPGDGTVGRTDSIHIISIDPDGEGVGVLSLPRDLYVNIPERGRDRINLVFAYGSVEGEKAGADLVRQTFLENFGIQVDHYVYVDFMFVVSLIDRIGGIDLVVPYTIDDPLYPDHEFGFDPFFLDAGFQHLDGETALKYMRTRHETNDFYRARRQHQVMLAVRDRVLDFNLLPNLITQVPALWKSLAGSFKTDLSPDEAAALALQLKDIDEEAIRLGVVDETATLEHITEQGASVLVPDTARVNELIETVLNPPPEEN